VVRVWEDATLDARGLSGGGLVLAGNQSLQGGGRIRGGVNATASGTSIVPGTSVGQITFTDAGAITLDSSTTVVFEVGGNGLTPGTAGVSYDQIVIDGTGVGGGGKVLTLDNATLQLVALPGLAYNTPYRLITTVGNASINVASVFAGLAEGPIHEDDGLFFQVNYDNSFFDVTFYVPEPSSLSLLALGVGGLLRRRRR
jgi:hypothetical protein